MKQRITPLEAHRIYGFRAVDIGIRQSPWGQTARHGVTPVGSAGSPPHVPDDETARGGLVAGSIEC
ncbi:hypothetical protein HEK616_37370 [Streptomyces nigrescens]|uniref:Uncharacterized protein n=1 Tax=Streptomyces nigrescens TaxID=1920 RepID=A0ABM7ZV50_STRNI|nr:hypothetical protein HEK616_37370 [Streptomyces nigrescens]